MSPAAWIKLNEFYGMGTCKHLQISHNVVESLNLRTWTFLFNSEYLCIGCTTLAILKCKIVDFCFFHIWLRQGWLNRITVVLMLQLMQIWWILREMGGYCAVGGLVFHKREIHVPEQRHQFHSHAWYNVVLWPLAQTPACDELRWPSGMATYARGSPPSRCAEYFGCHIAILSKHQFLFQKWLWDTIQAVFKDTQLQHENNLIPRCGNVLVDALVLSCGSGP